jgi:hypothetical protein
MIEFTEDDKHNAVAQCNYATDLCSAWAEKMSPPMSRTDWLRECQSWSGQNLSSRQHRLVDESAEQGGALNLADIETLFDDDWKSDRPDTNTTALVSRIKKALKEAVTAENPSPFKVSWNSSAGHFELQSADHITLSP